MRGELFGGARTAECWSSALCGRGVSREFLYDGTCPR